MVFKNNLEVIQGDINDKYVQNPPTINHIRDEYDYLTFSKHTSYEEWLENELLRLKIKEWKPEPKEYDGTNFWNQDNDNHFPIAIGQKLFCTSNYWGEGGVYRIAGYSSINKLYNCENL